MKDIRQTKEYGEYIKNTGWVVERIDGVNYFVRRFPLIGSFMKIQRPNVVDLKTIGKLEKKWRVFQTVIEPPRKYSVYRILYKGYRLSWSPYLPSKTIVLDLRQSKEKIYKQFKKDCRYALRKAGKLKVEECEDVGVFRKAWKMSVPIKRYVMSEKSLGAMQKAFGKKMVMYRRIDSSLQKTVAGAVFLVGNKTGYYWQAFTSKGGRKTYAQYRIVWEGILWAKKMKCKSFDFEGVYDARFPQKSWKGFSHFKKSFGGKEVVYPGGYVKWRLF